MATLNDVDLADTSLYGQSNDIVSDQMTDPFAFMIDHHDRHRAYNSEKPPCDTLIPYLEVRKMFHPGNTYHFQNVTK